MNLIPLTLKDWQAAVARRATTPFFYLPEAYQAQEVLAQRYRTRVYRVETPEGAYLMPLLESRRWGLRRLYSGPDGTYGGLLPLDDAPPAPSRLYQQVIHRLTGLRAPCLYLTVPHRPDLGLRMPGEPTDRTYLLDLGPDFDHFFRQVLQGKRRNIYRRGLRAGLAAVEGAEHLAAFLHLYRRRRWAREYPEIYWQALLRSGRARLWVAHHEGRAVAALWLLLGRGEAFYYLGVQSPESAELSPLTFLLVEALRGLLQQDRIHRVDLGASMGLGGVEHFKRSFGARPMEIHHRAWCRFGPGLRLRRPARLRL